MKKPPRSSAALCSSSLTSLQKPEVFPGLFETTGADGKVPIQFAGVCMTGIFNSFQLLHTGSVGKLAVKMLHDEFGNLTIVAIISGIRHHILLVSIALQLLSNLFDARSRLAFAPVRIGSKTHHDLEFFHGMRRREHAFKRSSL